MTGNRSGKPVALTIAGSDSGGGAGIQADLRTFSAFDVHGVCAITAVTAQNTATVSAIHMVPARIIDAQLDAVFGDFDIRAIKTGMLGSPSVVRRVRACLERFPDIAVIVDPVLVATSGAQLAESGLVPAMLQHLLARADLLTPNVPEAERLIGRTIRSHADLADAGQRLLELGARAVLLKGGHLEGRSVHDVLVTPQATSTFRHRRFALEGHGTGCTLSAAIAAGIANGCTMENAVAEAIDFVHRALSKAFRPGRGSMALLDHLAAR